MTATARSVTETQIIDFSGHLLTRVPEQKEAIDDILGPIHTNPELVAKRYADAGIDGVVLSQPPLMGSDDLTGTRAANDELLDIIKEYEQFYGLAGIPVGAGAEAAAAELQRCLDRGYHGGALETMSHGVELVDDELEPVLDVAEAAGAPLLVHPKLFNSLQPDADRAATDHEILTDRYLLNAIFGREAALAASIAKVIHTGVLDRHPDLNLVYHHLGGNIAGMMGRIHLQLDAGRFPGQSEVVSIAEFRQQLETRIYLDTAGFFGYQTPLRAALDTVPASQLLFGTDAPYEPRSAKELEQHWQSIPAATSLTASDQILGGNALELLANTPD